MFRNFACTCSFLIVCLAFAASDARGDISMRIFDDGTNLTMTATGSYDLSQAAIVGTNIFFPANALVSPMRGAFGWDTFTAGTTGYAVTKSGSLTGNGDARNPDLNLSFRANPGFWFEIGLFGDEMWVGNGATSASNIDNIAIFPNTTLASLGMVPGETVVVSWNGGRATITTGIPEPSSIVLLGLLSAVVLNRRRN